MLLVTVVTATHRQLATSSDVAIAALADVADMGPSLADQFV